MPHQVALTIRAPIKPGEADSLEPLFASMRHNLTGNETLPFGSLRGVHFARFAVIPGAEARNGKPIADSLVWASSADGPLDAHLDDLVAVAGDGIDQIFGHCEGYPPERTPAARRAYLDNHTIPAQAFYVNTVGRTVEHILNEAELRNRIEEFLDSKLADPGTAPGSPNGIRTSIVAFVGSQADLAWAMQPAEKPSPGWRAREMTSFVLTILLGILMLPVLLIVVPIWLLLIRRKERQDAAAEPAVRRLGSRRRLAEREDYVAQNQFSAAGTLKPGWLRFVTAHVILRLAGVGIRHVYTKEDLGTVSLLGLHGVNTIHFARWVSIDGGRRLIFMSNYDGSLERYMDDFINKVAWGLNGVFSHGRNYPPTRWMVLDGARDEQAFKAFLRTYQVPSEVWFSGYPHLTASNIANNAAIRAGLSEDLDPTEVGQWLRRL